MSRALFVASLIYVMTICYGQQLPLYNQYHLAPMIYNPSYAGFNGAADVTMIRNQKWGNYGEGFNANSLTAGTMLKDDNSGVGVSLYSDFVGITSKLNAHLIYSYRVKLGEQMNLRFGVGAGVVDNRIDFSNVVVTDPNDPLLLNATSDRKTMFDLNVGLNFNYSDFRIGFSVPQVLGTKLIYTDNNASFYTLERQVVSNLGYSWYLNRDKGILINPEALVVYSFAGAPLHYSANLMFELEKIAWIGVGYKSDYAVSFNLGINLVKNLKFGLAYDYILNDIATYSAQPNAEIVLKYSIQPRIQKVEDNSELERRIAEQNRQIDSLNGVVIENDLEIKDLNTENQILIDSLAKWPKAVVVPIVDTVAIVVPAVDTVAIVVPAVDTAVAIDNTDAMVSNPQDYFIELNGNDTPNGYFVITGAFAQKSNADALIRKIKGKYPNARIIYNKRNSLYYVLLYHATEKDEGLAYASYKAKSNLVEETWVLSYVRPAK